jgi:hypothetical protein
MLSALEAHENKIAQQRELSHKRESQRSASAALASQVGERRRSISSRFAANEAEHAQVLVNQANAAAREQVEAAIRAAKAADLAKSIQQQQAQNAAFKARSKAEDREFERQSAAALKAAVEADRIEQERYFSGCLKIDDSNCLIDVVLHVLRLKKAAEVQALAAHQENVRLKQQRTQAIKQAAKDDQELIRKWNETLDAQEAQRKKSIAEMEAKMVHKAAVGFKTAATVDERAKQDEERALRDQRAKDQAERERERAKLQAAADSKAEMLQSLNAQMAERRERRKQQFADHHDIVQQQKQLQKQVKLEAEAAKAQRQQAKSNYKQALDLQVALHPQQVMSQLTSKNSNKAPLVGTEVMSAAEKAMNAARLERARVFQAELSQQQQQHVEANKRLPQSELRWPASRQDEQARARG